MPPVPKPEMEPGALDPRVTISDLVIFKCVYPVWRDGKVMLPELTKHNASYKGWLGIWNRLAPGLGCKDGAELRRRCREGNPEHSPAEVFWQGIPQLLNVLEQLAREARERRRRVVIEGSEFGMLWLLPRVLARSQWLERHAETDLEIRQATWSEYLAKLQRGAADLCLGTACPHGGELESEVVLTLKRWLIYPRKFTYEPPKEGIKNLDALRRTTVFALAAAAVSPTLSKVYELLPPPEPPGRRIYVQSVAHMYQYVRQGLGVAIGYHPHFGIAGARESPIAAVPILDARLAPAEITLYRRADVPLSDAGEALRSAIVNVSTEIQRQTL